MKKSAEPPLLSDIDCWVFDLDHTLYAPTVPVFEQIEERMRAFIVRHLGIDTLAADRLRARYWREHGTTLAGLMAHHDIDPMAFLEDVHDIDFSVLSPDPKLAASIDALPGRKVIYTNGDKAYARRVLAALALDGLFEDEYGIEDAGFTPKPERAAFETVFALADIPRHSTAMFEDTPKNLLVPHDMGLATILVHTDPADHAHIHHATDDLTSFLSQLSRAPLPSAAAGLGS